MNGKRETTESSRLESSGSETDAYYYRARYYDPVAGRFLSEDPKQLGTGINYYSCTGNHPTVDDPLRLDKQLSLQNLALRLATFKYDRFGRRIYKSSSNGTSVYAYDGDNLVEEPNASDVAAEGRTTD